MELIVDGKNVVIGESERNRIAAAEGMLWGKLRYPGGVLGGLPNRYLSGLNAAIAEVIRADERLAAEKLLGAESRKQERVERFRTSHTLLRGWLSDANRLLTDARTQRRWVAHEQQVALQVAKPSLPVSDKELDALLQDQALREALGVSLEEIQRAFAIWRGDWNALWKKINQEHTDKELVASKWLATGSGS